MAEIIEQPAEQQPAEQPRDSGGRFTPPSGTDALRERVDLEEVRNSVLLDHALKAGLIEPDDSMDMGTWKKAFEGKQKAREEGSSAPASPAPAVESAAESEVPDEATEKDRATLDGYHERRAAFEAEHSDFRDVVGRMELSEAVSGPVQVAILEDPQGPEIAYFLAQHPEACEQLSEMSASRAVAEVGRIAERLGRQRDEYDATGRQYLGIDIPQGALADFHRRARELLKSEPLSEEEIAVSQAVSLAPHVSRTIIAMNEPRIAHHLARNPSLVGKLNSMHPLAAAGELAHIKAELDSENAAQDHPRLPKPISPSRKSTSTDQALSDSLSTEEWARRFRKKMNY